MRSIAGLAILLALGGCIPPSADFGRDAPPENGRQSPRLETSDDRIFGDQPVWETVPASADSAEVTEGTYVVQPGDTLSQIGERTGAGFAAIATTNALEPPYLIRPGQQLAIPVGRYHRVEAGETGIAIARAYGVPWARIVEANQLSEPFILKVGQRLRIPGGRLAPPPAETAGPIDSPDLLPLPNDEQTIEQRAAAFRIDIDDILTGGEPAQSASARPLPRTSPDPKRPLPATAAVVGPASLSGSFGWPANGRLVGRFGAIGEGERNDGIEIAVAPAASILASASGTVAFVGDGVATYGGMILIRHGSGWISAYGRVASASVTRGQDVKRGQVIGKAGKGTAPQVHFQLRRDRKPVDPLAQLPAR